MNNFFYTVRVITRMIPDIVLTAILSDKKSANEILGYCKTNDICREDSADGKKILRAAVAKQILKVSGYHVGKNFDYKKILKEMSEILLRYSKKIGLSTDNYDRLFGFNKTDIKFFAAYGSPELIAFLKYNGIDPSLQNTSGRSFSKDDIFSTRSSHSSSD